MLFGETEWLEEEKSQGEGQTEEGLESWEDALRGPSSKKSLRAG
jgi:hypothetical protein